MRSRFFRPPIEVEGAERGTPNGGKRFQAAPVIASLVALLTIATPAYAESDSDPVGQAVKQITGGMATILGSIFNPAETSFRQAIKERHFDEAMPIYEKNSAAFRQSKDLAPDVQALLEYARTRYGADIDAWISTAAAGKSNKSYVTDPKSYLATINAGPDLVKAYLTQAQVLRDFRDSDPILSREQVAEQQAREQFRADLAMVYREFPLERMPFTEVVSDVPSEVDLLQANWERVSQRIGSLSEADAQALVRNTSSAWTASPDLRASVSAAVWKRVAPPGGGSVASVQGVSRVKAYGLTSADVPGKPKIFVVGPLPGTGDMPVKFVATYDGALASASDLLATANGDVAAPTIVVDVQEAISKRNISDKQEIASEYKSGTRSVPNPDYAIAEMNCQQAQSALAAQRTRNIIAPAPGWWALLGAVSEGIAGANVQTVCAQFSSMRPYVEEPVFTSYTYNVAKIELTQTVRGRILAINGSSGDVESYPLILERRQLVQVAYGKKDQDRGGAIQAISDTELDTQASMAADVDAEALVVALDPSQRATRPRSQLVALLSERNRQAAPPTTALSAPVTTIAAATAVQQVAYAPTQAVAAVAASDARMQSVVVVLNPKGSIGAGFYVDANEILTNYHVIEGASTIELRSVDGQLFTGQVVRKDIGVDLALVRVERPGTPVHFSQAMLKTGDTVDAIGHPKGLLFSVSRGIVSAIRQMKGVLAQGGDKALVIQTDTPINPGNSGGPLYFKDEVVGVNTMKFKGADGIGFAVHYSEILKFLSQR